MWESGFENGVAVLDVDVPSVFVRFVLPQKACSIAMLGAEGFIKLKTLSLKERSHSLVAGDQATFWVRKSNQTHSLLEYMHDSLYSHQHFGIVPLGFRRCKV